MTTSDRAVFSAYRADIARRTQQLSRQVERDLAVHYKSGDCAAARQRIEGCLSTMIAVALEHLRDGPVCEIRHAGGMNTFSISSRLVWSSQ